MFRNMQNAEIIRKMTEEFDEVTVSATGAFQSVKERKLNSRCILPSTGQWGLSSHDAWTHVEEVPLQLLRVHQRSDPPVSVQHHL